MMEQALVSSPSIRHILTSVSLGMLSLFIISIKYAGPWTYGTYVFLPYVRLINCCFQPFRSSTSSFSFHKFFCFSNHQGAVFFFFLYHFVHMALIYYIILLILICNKNLETLRVGFLQLPSFIQLILALNGC